MTKGPTLLLGGTLIAFLVWVGNRNLGSMSRLNAEDLRRCSCVLDGDSESVPFMDNNRMDPKNVLRDSKGIFMGLEWDLVDI